MSGRLSEKTSPIIGSFCRTHQLLPGVDLRWRRRQEPQISQMTQIQTKEREAQKGARVAKEEY
jgi:hypothetical protein